LFYYGKDRRHAPLTIRTRIGCDCDFINSLNPNFLATWEQHDDGYPVVTTFTGSGKIKNISGKGFVALAFR
jgi:hypothetical protein